RVRLDLVDHLLGEHLDRRRVLGLGTVTVRLGLENLHRVRVGRLRARQTLHDGEDATTDDARNELPELPRILRFELLVEEVGRRCVQPNRGLLVLAHAYEPSVASDPPAGSMISSAAHCPLVGPPDETQRQKSDASTVSLDSAVPRTAPNF